MMLGIILAGSAATAGAQSDAGYGRTLSMVYNAHQRLIAVKEACSETYPDTAAVNDKAYGAWRTRYRVLMDEIDLRFDALIRGASTDAQDYARNYGKYHGAVMAERQEYKSAFSAQPREETLPLCREFPAYLKGADADFGKVYAAEIKQLRAQRPLRKPVPKSAAN